MNFATVRYGKMVAVANFKTESSDYRVRDVCIVRTDRGKELGEILTPPQPIPDSLPPGSLGDLLRKATPEDLERQRRLEAEERGRAIAFCREQVTKLALPMKVIEVEHLLGGEKIVFYFVSETRVDFRELVKILAQQFRTRIELKQVGARDQARLSGDCGHCGLTLCCRGFKKELGGIQMEMAKIQKQTVDPSKVCGRCGKLLCCLSYEFRTYTEARKEFPVKGHLVDTKAGTGVVLGHQLMQRKLLIQTRMGERLLVALDDVLKVLGPASPPPSPAPRPQPAQPPPAGQPSAPVPAAAPPPGQPQGQASAPAAPATAPEPEPAPPAPKEEPVVENGESAEGLED
jgi:cell fate regulator YaaT (PSP1 superfamily)